MTLRPDDFSRPADMGHTLTLFPARPCRAAVASSWHRLIRSCIDIPGSQNHLQKGEQAVLHSFHTVSHDLQQIYCQQH